MTALTLRIGNEVELARYVGRQLNSILPGNGLDADAGAVFALLQPALDRISPILESAHNFTTGYLNHLYGPQHATLLYLLGNEAHRRGNTTLVDRLFGLNRVLHCLDLYPAIIMPRVFLIAHGIGTVFANAEYGENLVVFQNVTVGRVGDDRPVIGRDVVLYSGAVVTGRATIGDGSVVAAGTVIHNKVIPPRSIVRSTGGKLEIKQTERDFNGLYLAP